MFATSRRENTTPRKAMATTDSSSSPEPVVLPLKYADEQKAAVAAHNPAIK